MEISNNKERERERQSARERERVDPLDGPGLFVSPLASSCRFPKSWRSGQSTAAGVWFGSLEHYEC